MGKGKKWNFQDFKIVEIVDNLPSRLFSVHPSNILWTGHQCQFLLSSTLYVQYVLNVLCIKNLRKQQVEKMKDRGTKKFNFNAQYTEISKTCF